MTNEENRGVMKNGKKEEEEEGEERLGLESNPGHWIVV